MIYLRLFLTFLEIGAVSFGGGYGMISLIREKCLGYGWLSEDSLINFIAVAESTPGPIAVNMATFVGSSQAGFFGSLTATLGLILPSFVIILIIATLIRSFIKLRAVRHVISSVKPVVIGLIMATGVTMLLSVCFDLTSISSKPSIDMYSLAIMAALIVTCAVYKKLRGKQISPILLIIISAAVGVAVY